MNKILYNLVFSLILFFIIPNQTFAQYNFTKHIIDDHFDRAAGVFSCDIDGDGNIDVLGAAGNDGIAWWKNNGGKPIHWTKQVIDNNFNGAFSVYGFDVDGDEKNDILGSAWNDDEIAWWKNEGGDPINWTKQVIGANFTDAHEVRACDFDGDGDGDVFGASAGLNDITWWRNDGGNPVQWTKQTIDGNFSGARSVWITDFDGDGDNDVCGAALTSNEVTWWRNDGGDPIIWTEFTITNSFTGSHFVYGCDLDKDGDQDILGAAYSVNEVSWWRNDGGDPVSWTKQVIDGQFRGSLTAYASDFDLDGNLDVVGGANIADDVKWWQNNGGDQILWTGYEIDNNFNGAWVVWADDIDGDGDIDVLGAADVHDDIAWWESDLIGVHFTADSTSGHAPMAVQFSESSVIFPAPNSWEWDFNNDGIIDSREQNPKWIFENPGVYSINLKISNGSTSFSLLRKDYIHVFNGASGILFNGKDSRLICPASANLNLTVSATIEAWINPSGWGSVAGIGFGRIVDKNNISLFLNGEGGAVNSHCLATWLSTDGNPPGYVGTPENSIVLNEWQHVAVTYDANLSQAKMYINGVEQNLKMVAGQPSGNIKDNSFIDLLIGNSSNFMAFEGIIDEVRIWNTIRSDEQLQNKMNQYLDGDENGLVSYWQMDEGNGLTINDNSGNQNTCIIEHATWIQGYNLDSATSINERYNNTQNLPKEFSLAQNYPNPFNSSTKIKFSLSKPSNLYLNIFDINGKLVKSISNGKMWNTGNHIYQWNGNDNNGFGVSSGLYLCKLTTAQYSETRKFLFIK